MYSLEKFEAVYVELAVHQIIQRAELSSEAVDVKRLSEPFCSSSKVIEPHFHVGQKKETSK